MTSSTKFETKFVAKKGEINQEGIQTYQLFSITVHDTCEHLKDCLLAGIGKCGQGYSLTLVEKALLEEDFQYLSSIQEKEIEIID